MEAALRAPSTRRLGSLATAVLAALLLAALALWLGQAHLIFQPARTLRAAEASAPETVVRIPVRASGHAAESLDGRWIPSAAGAKTVLYLHGNDDDVGIAEREVRPLRDLGLAVLLIDYRGFGRSDGAFPSEARIYEDAEAAWSYLVRERGIAPASVYLYGHSLGGAVAIELADRHPEAAGLIVESSFTSIADMARLDRRYKLLPVDLFLNQRFDSLARVRDLRLPVLFLHGTADELVPFAMGERLFGASGGDKRFVAIQGGRHDHDAAGEAILRRAIGAFTHSEVFAGVY